MIDQLLQWDTSLFLFLNTALANPVFDVFFTFITEGRNWLIPGIVMASVFVAVKRKQALLVLFLGFLVICLTDPIAYRIFKPWVGRYRPSHPEHFVEGARFLLGNKGGFSFPSNHASNAFGLATFLTLFYPRRWAWYFGIAGAVAFSRIYVGVHYPLDIFGGLVLGFVCGTGVYYAYRGISYQIQLRWTRHTEGEPSSAEVDG